MCGTPVARDQTGMARFYVVLAARLPRRVYTRNIQPAEQGSYGLEGGLGSLTL